MGAGGTKRSGAEAKARAVDTAYAPQQPVQAAFAEGPRAGTGSESRQQHPDAEDQAARHIGAEQERFDVRVHEPEVCSA